MARPSPFASLCAVGFLARFSYALARTPVLPLFALSLGAGPEAIGLIVGISTITGIFFKLPAGALSDLLGRKRTMLAGLVVFAVMPFTYVLVKDYQLLLVIRFLHGFATAIYGPVAMAVIMDQAGERKGEMLSWFSSVTIIGNLLGAPAGGFVLHHLAQAGAPSLAEFHRVYLLSGAAGVLSLVLALTVLRGKEAAAPGQGLKAALRRLGGGIREVMSDVRVVVTSAMECLQNLAVGALEAFLPIYAVKVAGLNEFQAGLLWGVQVLTTILAKPLMGRTSDKYGRRPLVAGGLVLCAMSFGSIPLLERFPPLLLAAAVFGLGEALVTSSGAALVAYICEERHFGAAMGAFGTIFDVGHAAGPILAGVLILRLDYFYAFAILAAVLLAAVPVFLMMVKEAPPASG
jgi:DHA1 family multidrug resistance protein-like MFS transporter